MIFNGMNKNKLKKDLRIRRHNRVRSIIKGDAKRPRLSVYFSLKHSYVQLIDDVKGKTLISVSDKELKKNGKNVQIAEELGKLIAKKALDKKIKEVVFDRGHRRYHGKIKSLADSAREEGLKF